MLDEIGDSPENWTKSLRQWFNSVNEVCGSLSDMTCN